MEMFGPILFVAALVIPALLLVALVRRGGKDVGQSNMNERSRVQMQREQNLRRRFDQRRHRVWSAIETAYTDFTTQEKTSAQVATHSDSAPRTTRHANAAPDWWSDLTDSRLAEMFDSFQKSKSTRRGKTRAEPRASRSVN